MSLPHHPQHLFIPQRLQVLNIIKHLSTLLRGVNETQLLQGREAPFLPDLLDNLPVLHGEDSYAREPHLFARIWLGQSAHREIIKRSTGVCASADPASEHVVSFGDERIRPI